MLENSYLRYRMSTLWEIRLSKISGSGSVLIGISEYQNWEMIIGISEYQNWGNDNWDIGISKLGKSGIPGKKNHDPENIPKNI